MDLSIVIVNWNSADYLKKCLETIFENTFGILLEIIVVDNGSYDESRKIIDESFPKVKFYQSEKNIGFARANNLGFKESTGKNLLFLNPDTEVRGPALSIMLAYLNSIPDAGAIGCKLLNSDESIQTSSIQAFPTILNQAIETDFLIHRFPAWKIWGVRPLFFYGGEPEPVEMVTGACLMIKRDVFKAVGLFSEDYFMYGEDVDLCYKVHQAGLKIYYVGQATIVHHGGKSSDRTMVNQFNAVLKRESIRKYFKKFKGGFTPRLFTISTTLVAIVRLSFIILFTPIAFSIGRGHCALSIIGKWLTILKWSVGLQKWSVQMIDTKPII